MFFPMIRRHSLLVDGLATLAFLGLLWLAADRLAEEGEVMLAGQPRVVDGDTLVLGDERIRLLGLDAPELAQTCTRAGDAWPCGRVAGQYLRRLIGTSAVRCAGRATDRYGRRLAVCMAGQQDLNARMVSDGYAVAFGDYQDEEAAARAARAGLWAGTFEQPHEWRARHGGMVETPHIDSRMMRSLWHRIEAFWTGA
jgi:endonuclease YncB( thermonuclease family)